MEERFQRIESNQLRATEFLSDANDRTIRLQNAFQGLTNDVTAMMTHMRSMIDLIQHQSGTQLSVPRTKGPPSLMPFNAKLSENLNFDVKPMVGPGGIQLTSFSRPTQQMQPQVPMASTAPPITTTQASLRTTAPTTTAPPLTTLTGGSIVVPHDVDMLIAADPYLRNIDTDLIEHIMSSGEFKLNHYPQG